MGFLKDVENTVLGGLGFGYYKRRGEREEERMKARLAEQDKATQDIQKEKDALVAQQEVEKKRVREKQIRMLRGNFQNPLLQMNPRGLNLGASPGLPTKLGE
jgi:hypothetical protein